MSLVKWIEPRFLYTAAQQNEAGCHVVPVIPLAALTEVVEGLRDGYSGDFAAYRWALNDLLAQLEAHRKEGA